MILWCTKHISFHCEGAEKCIFHALFMITNWNYVLWRVLTLLIREALLKKNGKKGDIVRSVGRGVNPSSFFKPKFTRFSNHSEMDFWHHNMSQYEPLLVFWHHNMSQYESQITQKWTFDTTIWVASPIYALLSVIRQQMSPFDPFRGGVAKRGQCPLFLPFFFHESFP